MVLCVACVSLALANWTDRVGFWCKGCQRGQLFSTIGWRSGSATEKKTTDTASQHSRLTCFSIQNIFKVKTPCVQNCTQYMPVMLIIYLGHYCAVVCCKLVNSLIIVHVLFFSRTQSQGWPHHGRTFSIYLCPLSFWLTLPRGVLSMSRYCLSSRAWSSSRACTWHCSLHYISPGNSLVSSWCDHSMLAALLWQFPLHSSFVKKKTHSFVFFAVHETRRIFLSPFVSKASRRVSFFLSVKLSQPYVATGHTSAFISRIFVEIDMLWLFHIFCIDCLTWYGTPSYTYHLL